MYMSDGVGSFTDETVASGTAITEPTGGATACDYDGDGDLDIFVTMYTGTNVLFQNQGAGTFIDVAAAAGVDSTGQYGYGCVCADLNNDGLLDFFTTDQYAPIPNFLYLNQGVGVPFVDIALNAGVDSMGAQFVLFGDYNNDGWIDLLLLRNAQGPNILYKNDGVDPPTFTDVAVAAGVASYQTYAGVSFDANDDGFLDLYLISSADCNVLLLSNADDPVTFTDATAVNPNYASLAVCTASNVGFGDFDGDLDLDLYVSYHSVNGANMLFENVGPPSSNDYISVWPMGGTITTPLANQHGAQVRLFLAGTATLVALQLCDTGAGPYEARFAGLGTSTPYDIEVWFPSGSIVRTKAEDATLGGVAPVNLAADRVLVVVSGACDASAPITEGTAGDCTAALASGSTCQPTCTTAGFAVSGTSSCSEGVLTAATCDPVICLIDEHVQTNACVECDPATFNPAGDDASGADTVCEGVISLVSVALAPATAFAASPTATVRAVWGLRLFVMSWFVLVPSCWGGVVFCARHLTSSRPPRHTPRC
jgi:hypothetical protein